MLSPQQIQEARRKLGSSQPTSTQSSRSSWDSIDLDGTKNEVHPHQGGSLLNFLNKAGETSGKVLDSLYKFSGMKAAGDLLLTASKGAGYGMDRLYGKSNEEAIRNVDRLPMSDIEKTQIEKGTGKAIQNIAGKSLEVAASGAAFAKGASVAIKGAKEISKVKQYGNLAKEGAKYGGAFGASKSMQEGNDLKKVFTDTLESAATGAVLTAGIPMLAEGTVRAAKNISSLYSGVPKDAIERAFHNPDAVTKAVRKYAKDPEATQDILRKANESFSLIKKARADDYQNALTQLQEKGYTSKISKKEVTNTLGKIVDKFNTKVLSPGEVEKLNELKALYKEWDDFTPLGVNDLKRAIRNRVNPGNSKELNYVITNAEKDLASYVNKADPLIGEMNAKYSSASEFVELLQKEIFGKTSKMSDSTKLNRLLNIFNQKSDVKMKLVEKLGQQGSQDLINEITGAAMSSWLPTGWVQRFVLGGAGLTGAFFNAPAAIVGAAGASPRIVGKATRILGKGNKVIQKAKEPIEKYGIPAVQKMIND